MRSAKESVSSAVSASAEVQTERVLVNEFCTTVKAIVSAANRTRATLRERTSVYGL